MQTEQIEILNYSHLSTRNALFGLCGSIPEYAIVRLQSINKQTLIYAFLHNKKVVKVSLHENFINNSISAVSTELGVCKIKDRYDFQNEINRILTLENFFSCDWLNDKIRFESIEDVEDNGKICFEHN